MPVTLVIDQEATTIRLSASTKGRELYAAENATGRDNQGRRSRRRRQRSSRTKSRTACLNKCISKIRQILPVTSIVVRDEGMDVRSVQTLSIGQGASERHRYSLQNKPRSSPQNSPPEQSLDGR